MSFLGRTRHGFLWFVIIMWQKSLHYITWQAEMSRSWYNFHKCKICF